MKPFAVFTLCLALFSSANAQEEKTDLKARAAHVKTLLAEKWLPFWFDTTQTPNGAFKLGEETSIVSLSAQSQMIWTFARAHRDGYSTPKRDYLNAARNGYKFLRDKMRDNPNGGFFAQTTLQGAPHTSEKDTTAHAFAILALVEFARASRESEPKALAIQTWRTLRDKASDKINGGFFGYFSRDWKLAPNPNVGANVLGHKSGPVHLQLLSASAELFDLARDQSIKRDLLKLLDLNEGRFFPKETENAVNELTPDWKSLSFSKDDVPDGLIQSSAIIVRARQILGERSEWVAFGRRLSDGLRAVYNFEGGFALGTHYKWKFTSSASSNIGTLSSSSPTIRFQFSTVRPWQIQYETLSALTVAAKWIPEQTQRPAQIIQLLDYLENQATDKADFVAFATLDETGKVTDATKASPQKAAYFDGRALMDFVAAFEN